VRAANPPRRPSTQSRRRRVRPLERTLPRQRDREEEAGERRHQASIAVAGTLEGVTARRPTFVSAVEFPRKQRSEVHASLLRG
jgi:hypothetical protein